MSSFTTLLQTGAASQSMGQINTVSDLFVGECQLFLGCGCFKLVRAKKDRQGGWWPGVSKGEHSPMGFQELGVS